MRFKSRSVFVALMAVFALSAVAATAAQAAEGPFWKLGGSRLISGETRALEVAATKSFTMTIAPGGTVTCTKVAVEKTPHLVGSTGATAGGAEAALAFSGCTITGFGQGCAVREKIKTEAMKATLARENKTPVKGEKLLTVWQPVEGNVWVRLQLEGAGCRATAGALEGAVAGEVLDAAGKAVTLEEHEVEGETLSLNFPKPWIKHAWIETAGVRKEVKTTLEWFGYPTEFAGRMELKAGKANWGAFS